MKSTQILILLSLYSVIDVNKLKLENKEYQDNLNILINKKLIEKPKEHISYSLTIKGIDTVMDMMKIIQSK